MSKTCAQSFWLFTIALLAFPILSSSHWWYMSQVYALGAKLMCTVAGLGKHQQQLCRENPDVMVSIGKGAKLGVDECQTQFKNEMWNCSTARDNTVFGKVMRKATPESAFVYAISSAGVVHEVTRACSRGELRDCNCVTKRDGDGNDGFHWEGCSQNIAYGIRFAKAFVDSWEEERDARAKMNLHNNRVGRRAVKRLTVQICKCHGISGSCEYKTCAKTMNSFSVVGAHLLDKYRNAAKATVDQSGNELVIANEEMSLRPSRDDLVFLEKSPNYCVPNPNTGSRGTRGRTCNKTTLGHGSCRTLCCGRGYNTFQINEEYDCQCKFHWCCQIKCQTCTRTVKKYVCQ